MSEINGNLQSGSTASCGMPETLRELLHQHEAMVAELAALPNAAVDDYAGEIARIQTAFQALPELPPEYAEILNRNFATALNEAEQAAAAVAARKLLQAEKLEESGKLRQELDALVAAGELVTLGEVLKLEQRWNACLAQVDASQVDVAGFDEVLAPLKARLEAEAEAEQIKGEQAVKLAEELIALTTADDMNALQERKAAIETEYAALGTVPKAAADRYHEAHRRAGAKLAQHYETLDLARWESYTLKLDLCNELDAMMKAEEKELPKIARRLREIRDKWKSLGGVPKSKSDEINPRYLELTRNLQHRVDEHYAQLRQTQKAAAAAKQALCEKVAALEDSTDWKATAEAFREAQAEWKEIPNAGAAEKNLYAAFRASADKFFGARNVYFEERNHKFDAVADAKRQLVEQAEALVGQSGEAVVRRAKALRSEYQAAGSAGRAEPELLKRFNAALDTFFSGRREAFAERETQSRALIAQLEALSAELTNDPTAAEARYRSLRRELAELGCRHTLAAEKKAAEKFEAALAATRRKALGDKLTLMKTVARSLAAVYDAMQAGEAVDAALLEVEFVDRFPRLQNAAGLMQAALAGDEKAAERMEKTLANARAEHDRICSALEKLVGIEIEQEANDAMSLAAELEAAIAGNFGGGAVRVVSKPVDPKQLLSDYLNAGLLAGAELEESLARFDRAYSKVR